MKLKNYTKSVTQTFKMVRESIARPSNKCEYRSVSPINWAESDSEEVEKRCAIAFVFGWRKKGGVPICVGEQGKKFVIPILYLSHPLFTNLLQKAREEYGFHQTGVLAIPCDVHEFQQILWQITFTISSSQ
ncbi:hypothetical protein SUGI_1111230 [Cryptomeria japonica]|nr:hypothetical protein SUGI_1111230 [Cryptomeria japonica]